MASSFLKRKAEEQAKRIDEKYGATAYGGSSSLDTSRSKQDVKTESKKSNTESKKTETASRARSFLERKAKEQAARIDNEYGAGAYGGSDWLRGEYTAPQAQNSNLDALTDDQRDYISKYTDRTYTEKDGDSFGTKWDNFWEQAQASKDMGRISQDVSKAYSDYLSDPTDANRAYADALARLEQEFATRNADVLDDEDVVWSWISQSAAGYLPQLWDQTKAGAVGALGGGAAGAAVGSVIPAVGTAAGAAAGAKAGIVAGVGAYSYDTMKGAAFRGLLEAGVDEATARKAANDEAIVSALIEMADTGVDVATLGVGTLLKSLGKGGVKAVAGEAAEGAAKKLLKGLMGYGVNIGSEMAEEAAQQAVSIANKERQEYGGTGVGNLAGSAMGVGLGAAFGQDEQALENRAEILEAAKEGGKVAAIMGGATKVGTGVANTAIANKQGKIIRDAGDDAVQALIESGLESAPETESHQLAQALQSKRESGKAVSSYEVGKLRQANIEAMDREATRAAQEGLKDAARESVARETGMPLEARQEATERRVSAFANKGVQSSAANTEARRTAVKANYGEYGTREFNRILESSTEDAEQVRTRFQGAYEAGLTELPREMAKLDGDVQEIAYNAGRQDAIMNMKKAATKPVTIYSKENGFVHNDVSKRNLSESRIALYDKIGKDMGAKIMMKEQVFGGLANGSYKNGMIVIAADATNPDMVVAKHEVTHRMQDLAPMEYTAFRDYAVQVLSEKRTATTTLVEAYQERAGRDNVVLTTEEAMDEIAADFTELILTDEKALRDFVNESHKSAKSRQMVQKFFDAVREFIQKVKRAFCGNKTKMDNAAQKEFGTTIEQLEKAEQLWKEAYKASAKAAQEKDAETKNATHAGGGEYETTADGIRYSRKMSFAEQVDAALANDLSRFTAVYVTDTPDIMQALLNDYPMLMTQKHIRELTLEKGSKKGAHGITEEQVKKLPELLRDPVMMLNSLSNPGELVVVTAETDPDGLPVIVAIKPEGKGQYNRVEIASNFIKSMYGRNSFAGYIDRTINADGVLYVNKKRTRSLFAKVGERYPESLNRDGFYNENVARFQEAVKGFQKEMFSLKDSEGKTLSEEQAEYFKDSVIRDENGNLMPMYHGTLHGGFTVFGRKDYWYFTNDKKYAYVFEGRKANGQLYPSTKEGIDRGSYTPARYKVYLNVTNPFVTDDVDVIEDALYWDKTLAGKLRDKGYDALMLADMSQVIVLNANQIKNTSNKKPTADSDIRFSLKDSDYLDAVNRGDMETAQRMVDEAAEAEMPNSKIRGKNGKLLPVYHGTNNSFFVFDTKFAGGKNGTAEGYGIYTSDNPEVTAAYGSRQLKMYANIAKPAMSNKKTIKAPALVKLIKDTCKRQAMDMVAEGDYDSEKDALFDTWISNYVYTYDLGMERSYREAAAEILRMNDSDMAIIQEVMSGLGIRDYVSAMNFYEESLTPITGFDGFFTQWENGETGEKSNIILAFNSNQLKSAEAVEHDDNGDVIPLSNRFDSSRDDIRFSLKDSDGRQLTQEQAEFFKDSKVRDENGNLRVLYHGTKRGGFTTFSETDDIGYFFTSSPDVAFTYSGSYDSVLVEGLIETWDDAIKAASRFGSDVYLKRKPDGNYLLHDGTFGDEVFAPDELDDFIEMFVADYLGDEQKGNYEVYLNITNPFIIDGHGSNWSAVYEWYEGMVTWDELTEEQQEAFVEEYGDGVEDWGVDEGGYPVPVYHPDDMFVAAPRSTREWVLEATGSGVGYDGVIFRNIVDEGEYGSGYGNESDVYVALNSNQIKSVQNKKPTAHDDIRFSLKGTESLMRENAKLKETVETLREQFQTTKFAKVDKKSLDSFAKKLLKDYQSGADIDDTRNALDELYTYIANGENGESPVWDEAYKRAYDTATEILEQSSDLDDHMYREYKALRDEMRTRGISLSKEYTHDLVGYESIEEFRRAHFGIIKMTKDGTPVDVVYEDLAQRYPEFFDSSEYMNAADQLLHIAEVLDSLRPVEVNRYAYNMRESATWLANDIMERFFELPQAKPTFADKAQQRLTKQVIKDAKKLEKLRTEKNERIAQIIKREKERTGEVRKKEREKRSKAVKQVKEYYLGKQAAGSERRNSAVLRKRIAKHASDLSKKLLNPTDKQHIPESLRTTVAAVLEAINLESQFTIDPATGKRQKNGGGDPVKRTEAFRKLKEAYSKILQQEGVDMVVDPSLLGNAEEGFDGYFDIVLGMGDTKLADMSLDQLEIMWRVIRAVERSVSTAGKMLASKKFESTIEWAEAFERDTDTKRRLKGSKTEAFRLDLENPFTFFSHYGNAGQAVFRMLRDAQDAQQRMVETVNGEVRKIVDPKQVKAWEKEIHEFKTERGEKLVLTAAHMMEIHELMKREQARDHLTKGGIVQPEIKSKRINRGTDAILLSLEDIMQIVGKLTKEQTEVADKLQALTTGILAQYGNEASMKAYGYEKFTGTDYWPIKSAREGVHSNIEKGGSNSRSIKNIGLAKSVIPHASNALDIGGIFSTFASHAADMTDYAAWLCPMEDANRLYNFKFRDEMGQQSGMTMKGLLDRYGGKNAQKYWHNLMEDIQNGITSPNDTAIMTVINKAIGNARGASVGANIRVIIQQPTAIIRAAAVLNPADMVKGLTSGATKGNGWKKALKYSDIAKRKDMGGFDISSPAQMNEILFDSKTNLQKFNDAMMWGAGKADAVTWGKIWNACEWAVNGEGKLELGSKEFYERASELFTEVVDQSQVVDGVLQRSQAMRSSNALVKQATAFVGEPTMAMNMMLRAYDGLRNEQDSKKRGAAIKAFGRAATVLLITNVVNAFAQSLVDAFRDDEDEEYWEKVKDAFIGLSGEEESAWEKATALVLSGNVGSSLNPVGYIPFAKDILSILQGYNVTRADADILADIVSAAEAFAASVNGDGKKTLANATWNLAKQVGKVFGISAPNMTRDIYGMLRQIALETGNVAAQYEMEKWIYEVSNTKNASAFMDILYKAYHSDKVVFDKIYAELLEGDYYKSVNDKGEVTTTAEYIGSKLKNDLIDDLFDLYKNDQAAYKEMYNDLIKRDFLKSGVKTNDPETDTFVSTADAIAKAMETRMKKDQNVQSVSDLAQRYLSPNQQTEWDSTMSKIGRSSLWSDATEKQRDKVEEKLYDLVTDNKSGEELQEKIDNGRNFGLDDTEYLLYTLALEMNDKPNDNGNLGSYNSQEKAAALLAAGMGDGEIAYLWDTDEGYDAYADGISMDGYIQFKAAVSDLEPGVDYVKGNTASRKRAINKILSGLDISSAERNWLYHTEYKK